MTCTLGLRLRRRSTGSSRRNQAEAYDGDGLQGRSQQSQPASAAVHAALATEAGLRRSEPRIGWPRIARGQSPRRPSDTACPAPNVTCTIQPISMSVPPASTTSAFRPSCRSSARPVQSSPEPVPDSAVVEQEREEFLRQFKSQLMEAHAEVVNVPESICKFGEHHPGEPAVPKSAQRATSGCRSASMFRSRTAHGSERSGADYLRRGLVGSFRSRGRHIRTRPAPC